VSEDALACELRLPPPLVHELCARLAARGLLAEEPRGFMLACDPARTTLDAVIDAIERDPALEPIHREALGRVPPRARDALASSLGQPSRGERSLTLRELVASS
jgi:DNA-binding IscR family transcriptional regulator